MHGQTSSDSLEAQPTQCGQYVQEPSRIMTLVLQYWSLLYSIERYAATCSLPPPSQKWRRLHRLAFWIRFSLPSASVDSHREIFCSGGLRAGCVQDLVNLIFLATFDRLRDLYSTCFQTRHAQCMFRRRGCLLLFGLLDYDHLQPRLNKLHQ